MLSLVGVEQPEALSEFEQTDFYKIVVLDVRHMFLTDCLQKWPPLRDDYSRDFRSIATWFRCVQADVPDAR